MTDASDRPIERVLVDRSRLAGQQRLQLVVFLIADALLIASIVSAIALGEGLQLGWDEIDRVEVEWTGADIADRRAGESAAQATGRRLVQQTLAANDLDNAVRRIDVVPVDYAGLRAARTPAQEQRFVDPASGRPGLLRVHLGQAVDERRFAEVVTVLQRELEARGTSIVWLRS